MSSRILPAFTILLNIVVLMLDFPSVFNASCLENLKLWGKKGLIGTGGIRIDEFEGTNKAEAQFIQLEEDPKNRKNHHKCIIGGGIPYGNMMKAVVCKGVTEIVKNAEKEEAEKECEKRATKYLVYFHQGAILDCVKAKDAENYEKKCKK